MYKDITGQKFGRLTVLKVLKIDKSKDYRVLWSCICECGNSKVARGDSLKSGGVKSCGCLHSETAKIQQEKMCRTHGKSKTKIYITYKQIQSRCYNKKCKAYLNYGGRGIKCLWNSFEEFYKDMGDPPTNNHSIDRVNNNMSYSKGNCRWATKSEQALNRRSAHLITYRGKTQNMKTWARELGIPNRTLWWRINKGWTISKSFNKSS